MSKKVRKINFFISVARKDECRKRVAANGAQRQKTEVVNYRTDIVGIEIDPGRSSIIVERCVRAQHLERIAHKIEHNVEKERCEQEERAQNKLSKERLLHKKSELEIDKFRACSHSKKDGCDDGIVEHKTERSIEETQRKLERVLAMTFHHSTVSIKAT